MNKRRKHGFRTGVFLLWLFIILLILSAITAGICIFLAFQDDYKNKYSFYQSDDSLMYTALKGAVFGEDFKLTETQVNTYINNEIIEKSGNDSIKNLRVYFENGIAEVYAKVNYMNNEFGLYAKAQISLDTVSKKFSIHLYNAKLGRLPIPDFILKDTLEKNMLARDIKTMGDALILKKILHDYPYIRALGFLDKLKEISDNKNKNEELAKKLTLAKNNIQQQKIFDYRFCTNIYKVNKDITGC